MSTHSFPSNQRLQLLEKTIKNKCHSLEPLGSSWILTKQMFLDIPFGYNETSRQKKKKKSNLIQFGFIDPHHGEGMISATIMLTWDQRLELLAGSITTTFISSLHSYDENVSMWWTYSKRKQRKIKLKAANAKFRACRKYQLVKNSCQNKTLVLIEMIFLTKFERNCDDES